MSSFPTKSLPRCARRARRGLGDVSNNPFTRNFNVAPTTQVPLLRRDPASGGLQLVPARWGLIPLWWKDDKLPDAAKIAALVSECAVVDFSLHPVSTREN